MSKTGRNDPCPCGSGKKFKRCCLLEPKPMPNQTTPPFAKTQLDERSAFGRIIAESEAFRRYYSEIRPQLSGFVVAHDSSLPVGVRARITRVNGMKYLRLRTSVCPPEDAALIAHEMGHLLQDEQGFPCVGGLNDHPAAAALNSALHDPLIDAMLNSYGFDLTKDQAAETKENIRQLSSIRNAPIDAAGRAHWIANCLGHLLTQHVLGSTSAHSDFLKWFSERYPEITIEASSIAIKVISIGFDTPEKSFKALTQARQMLKSGGGVIAPPMLPDHTR